MTLEAIINRYSDLINVETPQTWYPFSMISLNRLVGGKGLRGGRMVQIIGDKSTGKTTLAYDIIYMAQLQNRKCAYIDFERTYDPDYASSIGVNVSELILVKPNWAEEGLQIALELVDAGIDVIVIDSIPAAVPKIENEKEMTEAEKMAAAAGYVTRFCKRIVPLLDNHGSLCVVINQWRANISTMSRKESKPYGARQLQYSSSLTLELARIKNGEDESIVQVFTEKNKQGGKERSKAEITMTYGQGIDRELDIVKEAIREEIIETVKKDRYRYVSDDGTEHKAHGVEQAKSFPLDEIRSKLHG